MLSARPHGENSAVVQLLKRHQGRHAGLVRGGQGKRARHLSARQPGRGKLERAPGRAPGPRHLLRAGGEPRRRRARRSGEIDGRGGVWITENMGQWPSKRGPVSKITPSIGGGENSVPSTVVRLYDLRKSGGHDGRGRLRRFDGSTCGAEPDIHILRRSIESSLGFGGRSRAR